MTQFKQGTFDYGGFGYGRYWSKEGYIECTLSEAQELANIEGVKFVKIDRVRESWGYTHNWQERIA